MKARWDSRTRNAKALFLGLALVLGCSFEPIERPNVLLIVVDTLRADHLGSYGYGRPTSPRIDLLASRGVRFERAYATSSWTKPSIASMLTGLLPSRHSVVRMDRALPESARTLAERLSEAGYATGAVISHHLIGSQYRYDQGFDRFDEENARGHIHISTERVTREAISFLQDAGVSGRPFFLFAHYFDPHFHFMPHGLGFVKERPPRIGALMGMPQMHRLDPPVTPEETRFLIDSYDEEIRFMDAGIGELLDAFDEISAAADTLVIFAADHGEEFFEHGRLGHADTLTQELVHVPLIVRAPSIAAGGVEPTAVSLAAITPTVLDFARVDYDDAEFDRASLGDLLRGESSSRPVPVTGSAFMEFGWTEAKDGDAGIPRLVAVTDGRFKLVVDHGSGESQLFDLTSDPTEDHDLSADEPDRAAALRRSLDATIAHSLGAPLSSAEREPTEEEKDMLRGLGYLE